jgi:hypothetical protein
VVEMLSRSALTVSTPDGAETLIPAVYPTTRPAVMVRPPPGIVATRNVPPLTAGAAASVRSWPTSMSWSMVTVKLLARTTSPTPGSVPPSQVAGADQLPVATA